MKAYPVTAQSGDNKQAAWAVSQTEAAGLRKRFLAEGFKRAEMATHDVDVPTGKGDLIEFLNLMCSGPDILAGTQKLLGK